MERKPKQNAVKLKAIRKTLRLLQDFGPRYPSLNAHQYSSLPPVIPGEPVWEVSVQNRTPGAWRLFYCHGPGSDELTLITVGPHP
ncbi:hypothetical protein [Pilimelia anulata]|uniref:hypothetical protein n=1 Tax=Pilimelia anulata TaxID=53371 RepID=UPI001E5C3D32|nr:hypothetical protein [Pilimelia anulata]